MDEHTRKKEREKKRLQRLRKKAMKEAEENPGNISVSQLGLDSDGTFSTKHGFYKKSLTNTEALLAKHLHEEFYRRYTLDPLVDDLMLCTAIKNFVKSQRKEPPASGKDHNVRSYQAYYEMQFRQIIDALGLTRKIRREDESKDDVAKALAELFGKKQAEVNGKEKETA